MNQIQPYNSSGDYVFPTSRKCLPSDLTHSDREQIDIAFENHPAIVRRNGVTLYVGIIAVGLMVGKAIVAGVNFPAVAVCCAVAVAGYILRPAQRGTQQRHATPDQWPATRSGERETVNVTIINNVTIQR